MPEFSDQQRAELVGVLSALEAGERYMRARDDTDAARYLATRVRASPLTVRLETASLTVRALLTTTTDVPGPTSEETSE